MGWSFGYEQDKKRFVADLMKGWLRDGNGQECLGYSIVGNEVYGAFQPIVGGNNSGDPWIAVSLISKDRSMGWGSKDMAEEMGPNASKCPLKILKLAPKATDEAWRSRCFDHIAKVRAQRRAPKLKVGDHVWLTKLVRDQFNLAGPCEIVAQRTSRTFLADSGRGFNIRVQKRHIEGIQK